MPKPIARTSRTLYGTCSQLVLEILRAAGGALHPRQELTIMVSINGMKPAPFIIDTGAILSCISQERSRLPISHNSMKTTGFFGLTQVLRFSELQTLTVEDTTTSAPLFHSPKSPVNLLSKDPLCKLAATTHYSPTGLQVTYLDEISVGQHLLTEANKQMRHVLAGIY